ncbi:hypothetical protein V492_07567 [Pseudogymnoascus sp. VKM F-4246]|nr:hypothetical protein V492_07567 [Pseudogymnoascus sp. VKM F-4246]
MDVDGTGSSWGGVAYPQRPSIQINFDKASYTPKDHDDDERRILSQSGSSLLNLPAELLDSILSCLSPNDLDAVVYSCRQLYIRGTNDHLWQPLVQENVPGCILESPWPCPSYRSLYRAHDPHWFIPKMKIWFGDQHLFGQVMITFYNPYLGTIDGYRLVSERAPAIEELWEHDPSVIIVSFKPKLRLHTDIPLLRLKELSSHRYDLEIPMSLGGLTDTIAESKFMLARPAEAYSGSSVWPPPPTLWPPPTIPANQRSIIGDEFSAYHAHVTTINHTLAGAQKPQNRKEINEYVFRIRQSMHTVLGHRAESLQRSTYATLDPALYTPTDTRPFRGVWVGDYSGHGCEFILLNQPDAEEPLDESTIVKQSNESHEQYIARKKDAQIYRGRLEAIKLTGDPNIPRGQYTFIAEDIGGEGFVRIAKEDQFKGARIVRSKGHYADTNFTTGKYLTLPSALIIAQYWGGMDLISFFERVKLDDFITPNPMTDMAR